MVRTNRKFTKNYFSYIPIYQYRIFMTSEEFKNLALSFPATLSLPHFDRTAFKVQGKRIFATLHEKSESANIVLTPSEQEIFCTLDKGIYPVANRWGIRGWTTFELKKVERAVILEALSSAYEKVIEKRGK
jgi:predicted DNA-binding protein (MmcQ/YjbR family)